MDNMMSQQKGIKLKMKYFEKNSPILKRVFLKIFLWDPWQRNYCNFCSQIDSAYFYVIFTQI